MIKISQDFAKKSPSIAFLEQIKLRTSEEEIWINGLGRVAEGGDVIYATRQS
jgi:hypothetical protein